MLLGGHVLAPQAVATLLQTVGLPRLDPLLLQDLRVIQDLQAWNLADDILPGEAAKTLLNQIPSQIINYTPKYPLVSVCK